MKCGVVCWVDCKSSAQCSVKAANYKCNVVYWCNVVQCGTERCGGFIIGQDRRRFVGLGVASPGPASHQGGKRGGSI